jgi:hypothetical protein
MDGAAGCGTSHTCDPEHPDANNTGCRVWMCDETGAPNCDANYTCDPSAATAGFRGCRLLLCDEASGPQCPAFMGCQPDGTNPNHTGCVVLACDEPDGPECSEGFACRPNARYTQTGVGRQGCSQLLCNESGGTACDSEQICDPEAVFAATTGCAFTPCDAGWSCDAQDCAMDKIGSGADQHGCIDRPCTENTDCGCGYCVNGACEPTLGLCYVPEILATPYGCVWPDDEFV